VTEFAPPGKIPSGTLTFLFTDIEGSTKLWQHDRAGMEKVVEAHDVLLGGICAAQGGYVFKTVGDAFCVAFDRPDKAAEAAVDIQRRLASLRTNDTKDVKVRIAIHCGVAQERDGDYFGPAVNRVARLLSAAHGGQVVVSLAAQQLLTDNLPDGTKLDDLGRHLLKDLSSPERIYQLSISGLPSQFPKLNAAEVVPSNLTVPLTSLIGRESELLAVGVLLQETNVRLVTVTGTGGAGKTRLALRVGEMALQWFPDGVFLSELASLTEPARVITALRSSLGIVESSGGEMETAVRWLHEKSVLLILDNFEHVASAGPSLIELLRRCPRVKVLITSRVALRISGEHVYELAPLRVADQLQGLAIREAMEYESVRLFVARAKASRNDFEITETNARTVAAICTRLDGLPLAIELAAARIRMFQPAELLDRLGAAKGGALQLLKGGSAGGTSRHTTLKGAMEWSYRLLDDCSRGLLRRLSVFRGGFTFGAAEKVSNVEGCDALSSLDALLEGSLVRERGSEQEGSRYVMLETIREFASSQLDSEERAELSEKHARFYLDAAEELYREWQAGGMEALHGSQADADNLREAIDWFLATDRRAQASQLAGAARETWARHGSITEERAILTKVLPDEGEEVATDARSLRGAAWCALRQSDYLRASLLLQRSAVVSRRFGAAYELARTLYRLGDVELALANLDQAEAYYRESLSLAEREGFPRLAIDVKDALPTVYLYRGEVDRAIELQRERIATARLAGDEYSLAFLLAALSWILVWSGDRAGQLVAGREAIQLAAGTYDRVLGQYAGQMAGLAEVFSANYARGIELLSAALRQAVDLGLPLEQILCCQYLAMCLSRMGRLEEAAMLWGACDSWVRSAGAIVESLDVELNERELASGRLKSESVSWEAASSEGSKLTPREAISLALSIKPPHIERRSVER
jgi:predicted ATPase/class 3 adenylate cyclase